MGAAGWTRGVRNQIFSKSGRFVDPILRVFFAEGQHSKFLFELVSRTLFEPILSRTSRRLGVQNQVSHTSHSRSELAGPFDRYHSRRYGDATEVLDGLLTEASSSGSESSEKAVDTSNLSNERIVQK